MNTPDLPVPPALRELRALILGGGWRLIQHGQEVLIYMYLHVDGSVDTLAIEGEDDALAERTNPAGEPVWRLEGGLSEVIAELRSVPNPDAPNAPRLMLAGRSAARELKNSIRRLRKRSQ
jgi:hypothetical protein